MSHILKVKCSCGHATFRTTPCQHCVGTSGQTSASSSITKCPPCILCCCRYQQHVNGMGPPRWLLCQASTVRQPATGAQLIMLLQLDITESQQVGWRSLYKARSVCSGSIGVPPMHAMSNLPAGQHGADGWSSCRSQLQKQPSAAVVKPDAAAAAGALLQVSMVVTAVLSYCLVHLLLLFMCAEVRFAQVSQRPHARADACPAAEVGQCGHRERGYAACGGQAAVPRAGPAAAAVPCGAEANSAAGRGAVAAMPTQGQPHQQLSAL